MSTTMRPAAPTKERSAMALAMLTPPMVKLTIPAKRPRNSMFLVREERVSSSKRACLLSISFMEDSICPISSWAVSSCFCTSRPMATLWRFSWMR